MNIDGSENGMHWTQQIRKVFTGSTGFSGEKVFKLDEAEKAHAEALISKHYDYAVLVDAFLDFSVHTLQEAFAFTPQPSVHRVVFIISNLRRFKSGYNLFWNGYYFEAASHLRGIFENVLNYGAMLNGYVNEQELYLAPPNQSKTSATRKELRRESHKHFSNLSKIAREHMIGCKSGLLSQEQAELEDLVDSLHSDVHRTESVHQWLLIKLHKGEKITFLPEVDDRGAAYFVRRSTLACCAMTRILPSLSPVDLFSEQWKDKYRILDDASIRFVTASGDAQSVAYQQFISTKMSFSFSNQI